MRIAEPFLKPISYADLGFSTDIGLVPARLKFPPVSLISHGKHFCSQDLWSWCPNAILCWNTMADNITWRNSIVILNSQRGTLKLYDGIKTYDLGNHCPIFMVNCTFSLHTEGLPKQTLYIRRLIRKPFCRKPNSPCWQRLNSSGQLARFSYRPIPSRDQNWWSPVRSSSPGKKYCNMSFSYLMKEWNCFGRKKDFYNFTGQGPGKVNFWWTSRVTFPY